MGIPKLLPTTMYNKFFTLLALVVLCCACQEIKEPQLCTIEGVVNAKEPLGGFKVELFKVGSEQERNVVYTNQQGTFKFENLEAGVYSLRVTKDLYHYILMVVDDNAPNHRDSYIELQEGDYKHVEVLMGGGNVDSWKSELTILDLNGNPIEMLECPLDSKVVSFILFNETGKSQWFSVSSLCFFTDGYHGFSYFDSFDPQEGSIEPGDEVAIRGYVNPRILTSDVDGYGVYFPIISLGFGLELKLTFLK